MDITYGAVYDYMIPYPGSWIINPCIVKDIAMGDVYFKDITGRVHECMSIREFKEFYCPKDIQPVQLTIPVHTPDDGLNRPTYTLHDQISSHLPENKKQEQEQPGCGIEQGQQFPLF